MLIVWSQVILWNNIYVHAILWHLSNSVSPYDFTVLSIWQFIDVVKNLITLLISIIVSVITMYYIFMLLLLLFQFWHNAPTVIMVNTLPHMNTTDILLIQKKWFHVVSHWHWAHFTNTFSSLGTNNAWHLHRHKIISVKYWPKFSRLFFLCLSGRPT